ncbi:MAG TPA: GNAT family N-acetyltransferase [Longimicrobium sp.]|nr:GNAT family N-acetyltransferase [Longimicrobium sp.]
MPELPHPVEGERLAAGPRPRRESRRARGARADRRARVRRRRRRGWAAVAPRADTTFARTRTIPHVDDVDVWTVWCIRVRPGHRGKGISHSLLAGAVEYARSRGAPAIEGYPVDNKGGKVDLTMAYVGTRALFEKAGFRKAADTTSVIDGFPRVLMRLELR